MKRAEIERVLRDMGESHHGLATRTQLASRGMAGHVIDRLVQSGRLQVKRRGLYQIGPVGVPRAAEAAAVLASAPDGRISHMSAAALHGIVENRPDRTEVTMPRDRRRKIEGVRIHRVRDLLPDEVTTHEGIPVTTPARTLLDISETLSARQVEQALAKALRIGLVTMDEMRAMVARHPHHRGAPRLRSILEAGSEPAFTRSQAEEKLLELVRLGRLPKPEVNVKLLGYEVDFLWRSERLIVEVDGYAYHASPRSFAEDRQRDSELIAAGYRVMRVTWSDLTENRLRTLVRITQGLMR